ncbi:outer membrane beta-barrel protein [Flammeovirga pacifica]|uniref:Outer membrane protein OmpA-like transmembrane domain-containing protein n=1 Tax=Flammeovirga pacifica TaxID=915059 RepID=A0A1S1Z560_FLAPC|nr:outer membrane beta-barrel protein [Flammeovirga pacifica]OHX68371.1 hypothetical protein NH26_19460 [Flammeovirga pacifica]
MKLKNYLSLFTLLTISNVLIAQSYLGGNVGISNFQHSMVDVGNFNFETEGTTPFWRIYGGYQLKYLGIEGGYRNNGIYQDKYPNYYINSENKGFDISLLGHYQWKIIDFRLKGGYYFSQSITNVVIIKSPQQSSPSKSYHSEQSFTHLIYGLGLRIHLIKHLKMQLDWDELYLKDEKLSSFSMGMVYQFSK